MIVRSTDEGVVLITQPDHAQLAGRIMAHDVALAAQPRRDAILLAIAEHDAGWTAVDAAPALHPATGQVIDFVTAPLSVRHTVWPPSIARLAHVPWAATLVAEHAITVYDRYRANAEWTSFFVEMERLRDTHLAASGLTGEDLAIDYPFVRLGDLISLTFCVGWSEPQRYADWTIHASADRVFVTPDIFGGDSVPFEVDARVIGTRGRLTDAALRAELARPTTTLRGLATRG